MNAESTFVEVVGEGTEIGEDTVDPGEVAVIFSADDAHVIDGTHAQVKAMLESALWQLQRYDPEVSTRNNQRKEHP
jgi:hypothetical protein